MQDVQNHILGSISYNDSYTSFSPSASKRSFQNIVSLFVSFLLSADHRQPIRCLEFGDYNTLCRSMPTEGPNADFFCAYNISTLVQAFSMSFRIESKVGVVCT